MSHHTIDIDGTDPNLSVTITVPEDGQGPIIFSGELDPRDTRALGVLLEHVQELLTESEDEE